MRQNRAKEQLYLITEKGGESAFINEVPEEFTEKSGKPLKPVVEKIYLCSQCGTKLEDHYSYCPFCGHHRKLKKNQSEPEALNYAR